MKVITLVFTDEAPSLGTVINAGVMPYNLKKATISETQGEYQGVVDEVTLLFGGKDYSPSTHRITH